MPRIAASGGPPGEIVFTRPAAGGGTGRSKGCPSRAWQQGCTASGCPTSPDKEQFAEGLPHAATLLRPSSSSALKHSRLP